MDARFRRLACVAGYRCPCAASTVISGCCPLSLARPPLPLFSPLFLLLPQMEVEGRLLELLNEGSREELLQLQVREGGREIEREKER